MPASAPADQSEQAARLIRRVEILERATKPTDRPGTIEVARFSGAGPVQVCVSPVWTMEVGGQVTVVRARLSESTGTSNTTARLLVNGSVVGSSFTLGSGVAAINVYIGAVRIPAGADLQVEVTAAGAGAAGLSYSVVTKG